MHITQVRLLNFARYIDQTITFSPQFNAIVGPTDSGKSTILRALIWVLYNQPRGTDMCRAGGTSTEVTIWTSDGHKITRLRAAGRNAYILDGQPYDSIGTGVPKEVEDALGVKLAELGPKNLEMLTVSRQLDGPFLLAGSGSDSAKILGNLSGIEVLDRALAGLKPDLTDVTGRLRTIDRSEESYKIAVAEFTDLEAEGQRLDTVSAKVQQLRGRSSRLESVRRLATQMERYNRETTTIDDRIAQAARVTQKSAALDLIRKQAERLDQCSFLLSRMEDYNLAHVSIELQIEQSEQAFADLRTKHHTLLQAAGICPTCGASTTQKAT